MKKHEEILFYWFGNNNLLEKPLKEKTEIWFKKSNETDKEIKEQFEKYLKEDVENFQVETIETPEEALGYIILLDQFSRNIFRNTPMSFHFDTKALEIAMYSYNKGFDLKIDPTKRIFFYLPLEHSENIANQLLCLEKFDILVNKSSEDMKDKMMFFKDYAIRHYDVIKKFGRFPHRNNILGRESTKEEIEFLKQPNSSF